MKVVANIDLKDYWNLNRFCLIKIPQLRKKFLKNLGSYPLIIFLTLLMFSAFSTLKMSLPTILIITLLSGGLADIILVYRTKSQIAKLASQTPGIIGEHIYEINKAGIREITSLKDSFNTWDSIHSIHQNKQYIFVFKQFHSPYNSEKII